MKIKTKIYTLLILLVVAGVIFLAVSKQMPTGLTTGIRMFFHEPTEDAPDILLDKPTINIYAPQDGSTVAGDQRICAIVKDNSGISKIEFFISGNKIGNFDYPHTPKDIEFSVASPFWWDTRTVKNNSSYRIGVKATNKDNKSNIETVDVYVNNVGLSQKRPKLVISKHEVFRHSNTFVVELTVENKGDANAYNVKIVDYLKAFQPISRNKFNQADCEAYYHTTNGESMCYITDSLPYIAPGDPPRKYVYSAIPILMYPNPPQPSVGDSVELSYKGPTGIQYKEKVNSPVVNTTAGPSQTTSEPLTTAYKNAIKQTDFLIVTHPEQLSKNLMAQEVLSEIANLAFSNYGVLGYLNTNSKATRPALKKLIGSQGDWTKALHPNFSKPLQGYLLIVGQNYIIPAWTEGGFLVPSDKEPDWRDVSLSDLPYADITGDGVPELIVGRLIGEYASELTTTIKATNIGTTKALLISGYGNTSKESQHYLNNINVITDFLQKKNFIVDSLDCTNYTQYSKLSNKLTQVVQNKDVIYYKGHGSNDSWKDVMYNYNNLSFGNRNPFICASSCNTGNYKNGGIAETFFKSGASVYIGATEVSMRQSSSEMWQSLFKNWAISDSIGKALTYIKRKYTTHGNDYYRFWCFEFNIYGNPKLGTNNTAPLSQSATEEPKSSLNLNIPNYEVTNIEGEDYVEIPGGNLIIKNEQYRIPYYSISIDYPQGHEVQDVLLTERSDMVMATGLNIPITIMEIESSRDDNDQLPPDRDAGFLPEEEFIWNTTENSDDTSTPSDNDHSPPNRDAGFLPEEEFNWNIIENADGTSTLTILVYPFYYNPETTDVNFYKNYNFDINYNISNIEITDLTTDKHAYEECEEIMINFGINNFREAQDGIIAASIKRYSTGETVDVLPLQNINDLIRDDSLSFPWNSSGFDSGYYYLELTLRDLEENVLDRKTTMFRIGIYTGEIIDFSTEPEFLDAENRDLNISLTFENTGTEELSGTVIVKIQNEIRELVEELRYEFNDLAPTNSINYDEILDTYNINEGAYNIIGYVLYDSKSTDLERITVDKK